MLDKVSKYPKPTIVYPREVYMFRISRKETEGNWGHENPSGNCGFSWGVK